MILGGSIMIFGVIIQVTCFKGHNATAQLIIGRTITGVGNGIVSQNISSFAAKSFEVWAGSLMRLLTEHIHNSNLPS